MDQEYGSQRNSGETYGPTRLERADLSDAKLYRALKLEGQRQRMEAPRSAFDTRWHPKSRDRSGNPSSDSCARFVPAPGALAVGGYISLAGLWAAPISGASMNPARSFAPDLIRGDMSTTWIYVAGPVLGAIIAVGFEGILKGKPTAAGTLAARGDLN